MARRPRLELPGCAQHVIQRGNNRSACFFDDADRRLYLECLAEAAQRHACLVHAYVLMTNHVHLLATPLEPQAVSRTMQDIGRRYVRTLKRRHARTGTLWEGRFKASLVDSERYLLACHRYIEQNPVRAGIVAQPHEYRWSSHRYYIEVRPDPLLTQHACYLQLGRTVAERREAFGALFRTSLDETALQEIRAAAQRGWPIGSEGFKDDLEHVSGRAARPPKRGRPARPGFAGQEGQFEA